MRALQDLRRPRVLHPFMLAACPVLALYGQNATTLTIDRVYPALAVFEVATFLVWLVLARACRDIHRAGAAVSAILMSGFLAWPILETVIEVAVPIRGLLPVGVAVVCLIVALVALCVAAYRGARSRSDRLMIGLALAVVLVLAAGTSPAFGRRAALIIALYLVGSSVVVGGLLKFRGDRFRLTSTANVFGGALMILYAGFALLDERAQATLPDWPPANFKKLKLDVHSKSPDLYVLALDGYPRADVLADAFEFNNSAFLDALRSQGFAVSQSIQSEYGEPVQALAACFNLAPITSWTPEALSDKARPYYIQRALDRNGLGPALHDAGYTSIGFDSGIEALRFSDQFDRTEKPLTVLKEFERILCSRTIIARGLQWYFYVRYRNPVYWQFEPTRRYVNFVFDRLPKLAAEPDEAQRFVFAYVPVPEPPFLFTADGGRAYPYAIGPLDTARLFFEPEIHRRAFLDQLAYVNRRVLETVRGIQENASRPSVIIVMSLRGAALRGAAEGPPPRAPVLAAVAGAAISPQSTGDASLVKWFEHVLRAVIAADPESAR